MHNTFSGTALNNLKDSIAYSIWFTDLLIDEIKPEMAGESLIQIIRDIYLLQKKKYLHTGICEGLAEIQLNLTENELCLLNKIEKSMRKEEEYFETVKSLNLPDLKSILYKLKNILPKV